MSKAKTKPVSRDKAIATPESTANAVNSNTDMPKGWRMVQFDELVQMVNKRVDPSNTDAEIYVGLEHLDPDSLKLRRWGTPSDVIGDKLQFRKGDIIFGRRRAYQRKLAVAEFDGICSAHAMVVRANTETVDPEFLPFLMQSDLFMQRAIDISVGSLSPTINWKTLRIQEFPLPPKDEQRRIAELLWAADDAVTHFVEAIPQSRLLQRIAFREMQTRDENVKSIKTVGDAIIRIVAGNSPNGASEPATDDEYGVLKVSAAGEFGFCQDENKALLNIDDFAPELEVQPGFLLVTRANALRTGVGRACVVEKTRRGLMLSDKTLRLVEDPMKVRQRFLLEALRSRLCRNSIEGAANGTEAKNISQERLRQAPIWLPSLDDQDRVLRVIEIGDMAIAQIEAHASRVREAKLCLSEALFRGGRNNVH